MRRFAIFISCEKYSHYEDTPFCHADAIKLCETLLESCDYLSENVLCLPLKPLDGNGADEIIKAVKDLVERSEDGDSILFFFAGHGVAIDGKTYLVLPDTSRSNVPDTSLKLEHVEYYLSKNKRFNIRIFDCCHSGEGSRAAVPPSEADSFIREILSGGTDCSMTLASCAVDEKSYCDEVLGHGVFTSSLINAIKEQKAETFVYAETLKIAACDAVKVWCDERGKMQTPTLRAQVSGNMPVAQRKQVQILDVAPVATNIPLAERLQAARKIEVIDKSFYPSLKDGLNLIGSELEKLLTSQELYGMVLKKMLAKRAEEMPEFLKEKIILRMKSHRTIHTLEAVRTERPQVRSYFSAMYEYKPIIDVNYYITQNSGMPNSFLAFEGMTDGYIPSATFFVYVCPLQVSIAVIVGYFFDNAFHNAEPDYHVQKLSNEIYTINDFQEKKYIKDLAPSVQEFKIHLADKIDERLNYLEKELGTAGKLE